MSEEKIVVGDVLPKEPMGKKVKRIIINILLGLTISLVLFTIISVFFFNNKDAHFFGYKPYIISSESMEPIYQKHCIVIIKKNTYDQVKEKDLIAFKAEKIGGKPAFHRVIEVTPEGFVTKGDANQLQDEQVVNRDAFLGREVFHTNAIAKIFPLTQTTQGLILLIGTPVLLIAIIIIVTKLVKKRGE